MELVRGAVKGRSGALLIEGQLDAGTSLLLSYAGDVAKSEGVSVGRGEPDGRPGHLREAARSACAGGCPRETTRLGEV